MLFKSKSPAEKIRQKLKRHHERLALQKMQREHFMSKMPILMMAGVMMIIFSASIFYKANYIYNSWVVTTATVEEVKPFKKLTLKGHRDYYHLIVSYEVNGISHKGTHEFSGVRDGARGALITIQYNPESISMWRLYNDDDTVNTAFFFIMGLVFIIIPGFFYFRKQKEDAVPHKKWRKHLLLLGLFFLVIPFFYNSAVTVALFLLGILLTGCCAALLFKDFIYNLIFNPEKKLRDKKGNKLETSTPDRPTITKGRSD